ncbi:MAG: stalk domain-containing protein [Oscillospiraceae bacterium]|nr:stalk domain-containing protein [Oscillospiraceae bacterium]
MMGKMFDKFRRLQLRGFMAGVIVTVILLSTGTGALANTVTRNISVIFRDIRLVVDGNPFTPRDAQGNVVEPFIFEGTTFLPVRAVSDALGVPVGWDGATSTVQLGRQLVGSPFFSTIQHFRYGGSSLTIGNAVSLGNTHANSLMIRWSSSGWREYNLNAQWSTLTGDVLRLDRARAGAGTITFIGDGRELLVVTTNENQQPQNISVDVRGVLVLRIEISGDASALHNAMIE